MFKKLLAVILASVTFTSTISPTVLCAAAKQKATLNISVVTKDTNNDLLTTLMANYNGIKHYTSLDAALNDAKANGTKGVMMLADNYPNSFTAIDEAHALKVNELGIRLYIEYPKINSTLGIVGYSGTEKMGFNRAVVMNPDAMGMDKYSILYVHGAQFAAKQNVGRAWLTCATVAGYDTVEFYDASGLTDCTPYCLLEVNSAGNVLIASTKFSQFITARYAPYERWQKLWQSVLSWVSQSNVTSIEWTPAVTPNYNPTEQLSSNAYSEAVRLNTQWYVNNMLPNKNGSAGVYQCYLSGNNFNANGEQTLNMGIRADCTAESLGAIALAGELLGNNEYKSIARNAMDWMLDEALMANGDRANPASSQYGLLSWYNDSKYQGSYYGDDNAKAILGLMLGAAALETDEYDQRILEAILANFRTTGVYGFRGAMVNGSDLEEKGWEYYFNRTDKNYASHFESMLWACYLWAYDQTDYEPLLIRTKTAITLMMSAYEKTVNENYFFTSSSEKWRWTNGLQQERAKMILPLAWLVRIEPTDEHIKWLDTMITDMMAYQDSATGALREAVGEPGEGTGQYGPFLSNSEYGTHEAPVIQNNGDPCTDSLYTSSFAMMALNEAYAAMNANGNAALAKKYQQYAKSISDYHVRIQQVSDTNSKYNGVWFRGFDYKKWEAYGSDGDAGWGIWSTETGWSQSWISATLSMQSMNTNIWDYTQNSSVGKHFKETQAVMLNFKQSDPYYQPNIDEFLIKPDTYNQSSSSDNNTQNGVTQGAQSNTDNISSDVDGATESSYEVIVEEIIVDDEGASDDLKNAKRDKIWLWIALAVVIVGTIVASFFCIKKFVHKKTDDTLISENIDEQEETFQSDN